MAPDTLYFLTHSKSHWYDGAMRRVYAKAFGGMIFTFLALGAAIFLPAGTLSYWQAWLFLTVFGISVIAITVDLAKRDPHLLERRINAGPGAEKEKSQKVIQAVAQCAFLLIFIISALDHRLAWSGVPPYLSIAGDALVALGFLIVFIVFRENTFAAATIEVDAGQKVISTGPYAIVRHPMYSGAIVLLVGVPVALGSWWGLLAVILFTIAIVARLIDEEKFLAKNLPGYTDYCASVRWRLMAWVF